MGEHKRVAISCTHISDDGWNSSKLNSQSIEPKSNFHAKSHAHAAGYLRHHHMNEIRWAVSLSRHISREHVNMPLRSCWEWAKNLINSSKSTKLCLYYPPLSLHTTLLLLPETDGKVNSRNCDIVRENSLLLKLNENSLFFFPSGIFLERARRFNSVIWLFVSAATLFDYEYTSMVNAYMRHYLKSLLKRCLTTLPKVTHCTVLFMELASYRLNLLVWNNEWIALSHKDKEWQNQFVSTSSTSPTKSIVNSSTFFHTKYKWEEITGKLLDFTLSIFLKWLERLTKKALDVIQFDYFFTPTLCPLSFTLSPPPLDDDHQNHKKISFHIENQNQFLVLLFSSIFLSVCHQHFSLPLGKFKLKRALIVPSFDLK